jgi:hypothetical protein
MSKQQFQTEVSQLLQLIVHSLYSHPEIFLRELISNSSDALDKLRYLTLTEDRYKALVGNGVDSPRIDLELDEANKILRVSDTGIGMNEAPKTSLRSFREMPARTPTSSASSASDSIPSLWSPTRSRSPRARLGKRRHTNGPATAKLASTSRKSRAPTRARALERPSRFTSTTKVRNMPTRGACRRSSRNTQTTSHFQSFFSRQERVER